MKKLVIVGCGYLADVVVNAVINGLLPEYELVGVYSRTAVKRDYVVAKLAKHHLTSKSCRSLDELLAMKPDYLVETTSPSGLREIALPTLKNGTSIVTISMGGLADDTFRQQVVETAKANGTRIYLASGATGGFDVLRTAYLMGNASAQFLNVKSPNVFMRSNLYNPAMQTEAYKVFEGTAREAIRLFPNGLNVAVAASLASVGPDNLEVTMVTQPGFTGDTQRVEIENDQVRAVVEVYSATSEIAGWSIVSTLMNIVSPIVF